MAEAKDKNETFKDILLELMVSNEALDKISAHMMHMSVLSLESAASLKSLVEQDISSAENDKESGPNTVLGVLKLIAEDTLKSVAALNAISQVMSDTFDLNKSEALKNEEARREGEKNKKEGRSVVEDDKHLEGGLGFWEILLGIGAAIMGSFAGFVSGIRKVLDKTLFGILGKIKNILMEALGINKLARILGIAGSGGMFEPVVQSLDFLRNFFTKIGRTIRASVFLLMRGDEMMALKELFPRIKQMQTYFGKLVKFVKAVGGIAFKIGAALARFAGLLLRPLAVVFAIIDGLDVFKKTGDIWAGLEAGVISFVNFFTGDLADFIKDAISWVAGALGFEEVEKFLDSFSFSDIIGETIHRLAKAAKDLFEQFFGNIFDTFTDISREFKEGDILGVITEIFRGMLKTFATAVLDIPKNLLASVAEGLGLDSIAKSMRDFSFSRALGGTHTETGGEVQTDTKSIIAAAGETTATKAAAKELKKKTDAASAGQESNPLLNVFGSDPFGDFGKAMLDSYRMTTNPAGAAIGPALVSSAGADISAFTNSTKEMRENAASGGSVAIAPVVNKNTVSNNNSSVTIQQSNHPNKTEESFGYRSTGH